MVKLAKIAQRKRNQKEIDDSQDETNRRQDEIDIQHKLTNFYQSVALIVYGVMLFGIFVVALVAGVLK